MLLPRIELPVPEMTSTPIAPLNAIVFACPAKAPPMVLLFAVEISMPLEVLPRPAAPLALVPMALPRT